MRRCCAVLLILAAFAASSCTDADESSNAPSGGSTNSEPYTSESGQEYDEKGFPLDENGEVSDDPEDYREAVCNSGLYDDAPDYEEQCQ